jgi:site-specific DNA recombinase
MNEIRSTSDPRMKKALIYARFSTDLQNERSIEDQITLCSDYASRNNIDVIDVHEDRARSGGSIMGRDGLLRLLDRAKDGSFDIVVVEALDRLSRDMEDLAGIHKRLSFLGIEIRAVHEGVVNTVLVGLRGLVGQLYREDNAHKVRRGLSGRVGQGLNAGLTVMRQLPATRASEQLSKLKHRSSGEFLRSILAGGLLAKLPTT